MPSRSRPSSPSPYEKEKPYDQGSDPSSDEDFVNAATAPRPSSRASAASGASRSSRRAPPAISESSSESIDSEEERELQSELQDAAGTETGVVRGAPIESTGARIMRSVGKGSSSSAQRYASLADAEKGTASRSSSRRHHHKRKSSQNYSLADSTKQRKQKGLTSGPGAGTFSDHRASTLQGKTKSRKWLWISLGIGAVIVLGAIIAAVIFFVKRKSGSSGDDVDSASNSTSLADHGNLTTGANSTAAHHSANSTGDGHGSTMQTHLPVDGSMSETASAANANGAAYDDGKYHPATATATTPGLAGEVNGLQQGTVTGPQTGFATNVPDAAQAGQSSASAPNGAHGPSLSATPSQVYGMPPSYSSDTNVVADPLATAGATANGPGAVSIQTVPNADPAGQGHANESPATNAGQWNALSTGAPQPTPAPGDQGAGGQDSHSSIAFGVGPVVPSATPSEGASNAGAGAGGEQGHGADNGQASSWDAAGQQAPVDPGSPIDSTAPGPFTSGEFKQATHPESFQTYMNAPGTWFESSGHYGACGLATNNTDFVVAINDAIWLNSTKGSKTAQSSYCGAEVLITSMADGATVNAWVTERCAYCSTENAGSIDLSKAVFKALSGGSTDAGSLTLVWGFTGNHSTAAANDATATAQGGTNSTATAGDSDSTASSEDGSWFNWKRQVPTPSSLPLAI